MASISTSLGLGSGIDTTQLVKDLTAASRAPKERQIAAKEAANTAKVSALADASNGIVNFSNALNTLIAGGSLYTQPTSSDSSSVTATALPGARLADLSVQFEVKAVAKAQSLVSATGVARDAQFGAGGFTITNKAGVATAITVKPNDSTLAGIARAINASGAGVTATIVTQGATAKLVMKGATGADGGFTVQATDAFAALAYDGTTNAANGMKSTQVAQDAVIVMDGVESTRPTNSISDLIPGVKLELKKATGSEGVTLGTASPVDAIRLAVQDFASAYNELKKTLDASTASGLGSGTAGTAGALRGNLNIREMQRMMGRISTTPLSSGGSPSTLAEVGVKTGRDGSLSVDLPALDRMLAERPDKVEALFNPTQNSSDPLVQITSAMGKTKPGTYEITDIEAGPPARAKIDGKAAVSIQGTLSASFTTAAAGLSFTVLPGVTRATITVDAGLAGMMSNIVELLNRDFEPIDDNDGVLQRSREAFAAEAEQLVKDRAKMESQSSAYEARLTKSYTEMEKRVTAMNATKAYLSQQIEQWNNQNN